MFLGRMIRRFDLYYAFTFYCYTLRTFIMAVVITRKCQFAPSVAILNVHEADDGGKMSTDMLGEVMMACIYSRDMLQKAVHKAAIVKPSSLAGAATTLFAISGFLKHDSVTLFLILSRRLK